jgi:hypothetical protein
MFDLKGSTLGHVCRVWVCGSPRRCMFDLKGSTLGHVCRVWVCGSPRRCMFDLKGSTLGRHNRGSKYAKSVLYQVRRGAVGEGGGFQ